MNDKWCETGANLDKNEVHQNNSSMSSPEYASIDKCLAYLHQKVTTKIPDSFSNYLKNEWQKLAPEGQVNWREFVNSSKRWIEEMNSGNNKINFSQFDDQMPNSLSKSLNESLNDSKNPEIVECSIISPKKIHVVNKFFSPQINGPSEKMDSSIEVELQSRINQKNEEITWLREEVITSEQSSIKYQKLSFTLEKKLNAANEKLNQLEKENEEQKETISILEEQEKKLIVLQTKVDRERAAFVDELDDKDMKINELNKEIEKLEKNIVELNEQLKFCQGELNDKETLCEILKEKLENLNEINKRIERDYQDKILYWSEENKFLKNDNAQLLMKINNYLNVSSNVLVDLNVSPCSIYPNSFSEILSSNNTLPKEDSLFTELKESGFSLEETRNNQKINELEEELNWYNEQVLKVCDQIEMIMKQLNGGSEETQVKCLLEEDKCNFILSNKISLLSDKVTEIVKKPLTTDSSCQVEAELLLTQQYKDLQILTFADDLNKLINIQRNPRNDLTHKLFFGGFNEISKHQYDDDTFLKNYFGTKLNGNGHFNTNSDLVNDKSPHSNTVELESKISLRSISVGGDYYAKEQQQRERESSHSFNNSTNSTDHFASIPLSPIYQTVSSSSLETLPSNMNNKSPPKRKLSVFARTFDIEKISENQTGENMLTSTPMRGGYRSSSVLNDSCDSESPLTTLNSSECSSENSITNSNSLNSVNKQSVILAPSKLDFVKYQEVQSDQNSLINLNECSLKIESGGGEIRENSHININNHQLSSVSSSNPINKHSFNDLSMKTNPKITESTERLGCSNLENDRVCGKDDVESTGAVTVTNSTSKDIIAGSQPIIIANNCQLNHKDQVVGVSSLNNYTKSYTYKSSNKSKMIPPFKRSKSDGENLANDAEGPKNSIVATNDLKLSAFPSFFKSPSFSYAKGDELEEKNLSENELERMYLIFSLGLCTDRTTLMRRKSLSTRQRDQTERNLVNEIDKMQQSIQELVPMCFDAETIEGIDRVRNQIEVIARCAHKVSCTSETYGAIQQELRFSRAIYLADKYLRLLRSRLEKSVADLAVSKQILVNNNIVIDEHTGEAGEELVAIRYRGLPANNRTMIAKRRASIATIFRPFASNLDTSKDGVKQRNSISGRVTVRRPSFSGDQAQRIEVDKLNRTESSNSVGELREICEQTGPRIIPREEITNNIMRLPVISCENEVTNPQAVEPYSSSEQQTEDVALGRPRSRLTWIISGFLLSFILGFCIKDVFAFGGPFRWWSLEELLDRHAEIRNLSPRPI